MRIFEKKAVKSPQRQGRSPRTPIGLWRLWAPPPDPRIITFTYCCRFRRVRF